MNGRFTQLVYAMEEYRNELCVIFAGYDTEMKALFKANSGLLSRVPMHLRFADYDADQLVAMAAAGMQNADLTLLPESEEAVRSTIRSAMRSGGGKLPGNGRWIRTFLEKVRLAQSHRIWLTQTTDLCSLFPEDIKGGAEAMQDAQEASQRIGF